MDNAEAEIRSGAIAPPRNRRRIGRKETKYPPPISSLTRAENHPSRVPRVMRKYYSGDGRLIIREEKVDRHEYLAVHRSDGRLVVNLVPMYDDVEEGDGIEIDDRDEGKSDPTVNSRCSAYKNGLGVDTCGGFASPAFTPPVPT